MISAAINTEANPLDIRILYSTQYLLSRGSPAFSDPERVTVDSEVDFTLDDFPFLTRPTSRNPTIHSGPRADRYADLVVPILALDAELAQKSPGE